MGILARLVSIKGLFRGVDEADLERDPFAQFARWFALAQWAGVYLPNALTLATATPDGKPSARLILLKGFDRQGFVFFTNYESRKGGEIAQNPAATLVFFWPELWRQVRVEGVLEKVTAEESNAYFQSRPRGSRLGAWASRQSQVIPDRASLEREVEWVTARFAGQEVPLPPFWGGYRLVPQRLEFWQGRVHRLHDRFVYTRTGEGWAVARLSP